MTNSSLRRDSWLTIIKFSHTTTNASKREGDLLHGGLVQMVRAYVCHHLICSVSQTKMTKLLPDEVCNKTLRTCGCHRIVLTKLPSLSPQGLTPQQAVRGCTASRAWPPLSEDTFRCAQSWLGTDEVAGARGLTESIDQLSDSQELGKRTGSVLARPPVSGRTIWSPPLESCL